MILFVACSPSQYALSCYIHLSAAIYFPIFSVKTLRLHPSLQWMFLLWGIVFECCPKTCQMTSKADQLDLHQISAAFSVWAQIAVHSKQTLVHKGPKNLLILCRDQGKRDTLALFISNKGRYLYSYLKKTAVAMVASYIFISLAVGSADLLAYLSYSFVEAISAHPTAIRARVVQCHRELCEALSCAVPVLCTEDQPKPILIWPWSLRGAVASRLSV